MTELDTEHEAVEALTRLLPEATTAGGSFAPWIPAPYVLSPADRRVAFHSSQKRAIDHCLSILRSRVGINETNCIATGEGGDRQWPPGFVGSLTHKGTVVLGALVQTSAVRMIGIDLERLDRPDLGALEAIVAPEGLPRGIDRERGILLSFSAKEAVFKAQYPITRQQLNFSDLRLDWEADGIDMRAAVDCAAGRLIVRCVVVGKWIVAAAICPIPFGG